MKLKTLKDIEEELDCDYSPDLLIGDKVVRSDRLKAEAIKWIKAGKPYDMFDTWFDTFKDFFNITEEDLNA